MQLTFRAERSKQPHSRDSDQHFAGSRDDMPGSAGYGSGTGSTRTATPDTGAAPQEVQGQNPEAEAGDRDSHAAGGEGSGVITPDPSHLAPPPPSVGGSDKAGGGDATPAGRTSMSSPPFSDTKAKDHATAGRDSGQAGTAEEGDDQEEEEDADLLPPYQPPPHSDMYAWNSYLLQPMVVCGFDSIGALFFM